MSKLEDPISLQSICLVKIINNFDIYYTAYSATNNASFKLKFEFLRRVYSFYVTFVLWKKNGSLEAKYVDCLINKYLKALNTKWLDNCSWDVAAKKIAEIGFNLEYVTFYGDELPWEEVVCHLPNLKTVIYKHDCSNTFLHSIAMFCPHVETIDVSFSERVSSNGIKYLCCSESSTIDVSFSERVSSNGIKYLCCSESSEVPCPALRNLSIKSTNVGNDGIKYLVMNMPFLQSIDYWQKFTEVLYSIYKSDINLFDKVKPYYLTHLNMKILSHSPILDDALEICLSVCPHLKSLTCPVLKPKHLNSCLHLTKLEKLDLLCYGETAISVNDFLKCKGNTLLSLDLLNFSVSVSVLAQNCPHLISLKMKRVTFLPHEYDSSLMFQNLEILCFEDFHSTDMVTTQSMIWLMLSSPNLKHLGFQCCSITKFSADVITNILRCCKYCKLDGVYLDESMFDDEFVEDVLLTCSSLKHLGLDGLELYSRTRRRIRIILDMLPNNYL